MQSCCRDISGMIISTVDVWNPVRHPQPHGKRCGSWAPDLVSSLAGVRQQVFIAQPVILLKLV